MLLLAALPFAGAAGGLCVPSCDVIAQPFGYVSPVTVAQSGSTVSWTSLSGGHPTAPDSTCFVVQASESTVGKATFRLDDERLFAAVDNVEKMCPDAVAAPDGSAILPYRCLIHPAMRGVLVVTP